MERSSAGEDFSYFAQQVPGLFYFVGITPPDVDPAKAPGNHSPRFKVDEAGLILGFVRRFTWWPTTQAAVPVDRRYSGTGPWGA